MNTENYSISFYDYHNFKVGDKVQLKLDELIRTETGEVDYLKTTLREFLLNCTNLVKEKDIEKEYYVINKIINTDKNFTAYQLVGIKGVNFIKYDFKPYESRNKKFKLRGDE